MDYIQKAHKLLQDMDLKSVHSMLKSANASYLSWESREIVLCGFSPYAKKLIDTLLAQNILPDRLLIVDTEDSPEFFKGVRIRPASELKYSRNAVYILCTNPYMGYYANLLQSLGECKVITYHMLAHCDERYDYPLERYSGRIVTERIEHLLRNKEFYSEFLENLADMESKEIMSKWILYHLTLDAAYCGAAAISPPYFGQKFLPSMAYSVFADLGGFNGDTLKDFLSLGLDFNEYWFFEPDEDLYNQARKISNDQRIKYNNTAMGSFVGRARYAKTGSTTGTLSDCGNTEVSVNTIDNIAASSKFCKTFTAIKMDVEGAEVDALRGAEKTIQAHHPALMVSVEHKPDDIKTLSELILSFCGEYKFYLRCCTDSLFTDLTLFAVVE